MDITKRIISTLYDVHQNGISQIEKVAEELKLEIETHPQVLGIYCYSGTPIPVAYFKGIINYFSNKN